MKSESFRKQALSLVLFFAAIAAVFALTRLRSDPAKKQAEFVVQQQHHTLHGAQVEVCGGDHLCPAAEAQTAILHPDVLCADAGQLKFSGGFAPEKAGRDQFKFCGHGSSFLFSPEKTDLSDRGQACLCSL